MNETLLGIVGVLVAALIWQVKASAARLELREDQLKQTLDSLRQAVEAFGRFEKTEEQVHQQLVARLDEHQTTQLAILSTLERINDKLDYQAGLLQGRTP